MPRSKRKAPPKSQESQKSEEAAVISVVEESSKSTKNSSKKSTKSSSKKLQSKPVETTSKFPQVEDFENAKLCLEKDEKLGIMVSRSLPKDQMGQLNMQISMQGQLMKRFTLNRDIYEGRVHVYVVADSEARNAFTGRMVGCYSKGISVIQYTRFTELLKALTTAKDKRDQINLYDYMPQGEQFQSMRTAVKDNKTNPPFAGITALFWLPNETLSKESITKHDSKKQTASKKPTSVKVIKKIEESSTDDNTRLAQCYLDIFKVSHATLYQCSDIERALASGDTDLLSSIDLIIVPFEHTNEFESTDHPLPQLPSKLKQLTIYTCRFTSDMIEHGRTKFLKEKMYDGCVQWCSRSASRDYRVSPTELVRTASGGFRTSQRMEQRQVTPKQPKAKRQRLNTTPSLSQLKLSEKAPDSPTSDHVLNFKPDFVRSTDWFAEKHREMNLNRALLVRERLSMILTQFRPDHNHDIPESCACKVKPSNLYEIERFDLEYSFTLTNQLNRDKVCLFLQATELAGWEAVTKKIHQLYISAQPARVFTKFCDRALLSVCGRMLLARCPGLMENFRDAMNATGHHILNRFVGDRLFKVSDCQEFWNSDDFDYRIALFWALGSDDVREMVTFVSENADGILTKEKSAETAHLEWELEKFVARVFRESLAFTTKDRANKFIVALLKKRYSKLALPDDRLGDVDEAIQLYRSMMQYPEVLQCHDKTTLCHSLDPNEIAYLIDKVDPPAQVLLQRLQHNNKTALHSLVDALNSGKLKSQSRVDELVKLYIQRAPAALFAKDKKGKTPLQVLKWEKIPQHIADAIYTTIPEKMRDDMKTYISKHIFENYHKPESLKEFPDDFDGPMVLPFHFDPVLRMLVSTYLINFYSFDEHQEKLMQNDCGEFLDHGFLV